MQRRGRKTQLCEGSTFLLYLSGIHRERSEVGLTLYSRGLFSFLQVQWWGHPLRVRPSTPPRRWPSPSPPPVLLLLSLALSLGSFFLASAGGTSMPTHTRKLPIWIQNSTSKSSKLMWVLAQLPVHLKFFVLVIVVGCTYW